MRVLLFIIALIFSSVKGKPLKQNLKYVQKLEFYKDKLTTSDGFKQREQLNCIGGSGYNYRNSVENIICENIGVNMLNKTLWKCDAKYLNNVKLGDYQILCEEYPDKPKYIIKNSCSIDFKLENSFKKENELNLYFLKGVYTSNDIYHLNCIGGDAYEQHHKINRISCKCNSISCKCENDNKKDYKMRDVHILCRDHTNEFIHLKNSNQYFQQDSCYVEFKLDHNKKSEIEESMEVIFSMLLLVFMTFLFFKKYCC
ncbi:MAG: hypothetical protein CMF62_00660 [Magnetococcales bacterium]|nr:hypothetical protein [Magnetococcales bacterium]|tara:strand:- start:22721 stop:23488 length:768 start_codon:yes stop_codon:yes gene_type:complete